MKIEKVLLIFDILEIVFKNKKNYFKQTLKKVTDCIEERFKIEEHLETFGVKRNDINGELRRSLDDLTEVYLFLLLNRKELDILLVIAVEFVKFNQ